jgi:hypothetical protein
MFLDASVLNGKSGTPMRFSMKYYAKVANKNIHVSN